MNFKDKKEIRKKILLLRDSIDESLRQMKDKKIFDRLINLPEFIAANKILLYASFKSEVSTADLLKYCIKLNKTIVFPKVDKINNFLVLYKINSINNLKKGYMGIPEPEVSEEYKVNVNDLDLIIVPGVAFDEKCNRLGYGKGFYDKLLKGIDKTIIGLAYEEQIVQSLIVEKHDIRINKIVTDKRIIECDLT
jgi:5-formyltetrahydrofolate cyclo-ligase